MTCLGDSVLATWASGTIPHDARAQALEHIAECASCRQALSALAHLDAAVGTPDTGPSSEARRGGESSFGRYRLDAVLGSGGMGIVYSGFDPELKRAVAIKVVRRHTDAQARQRLVREAQALARLSHRHICQVHDVGSEGDEVWVAMERIDGVTLREWALRPMPVRELLGLLATVGEALAAAHAAELVHRDVKPENVLVTKDGRAVVTDFGLADVDAGATDTSPRAGTPGYLAPEQLAGGPIDARVDQFAFAVMAWELLTGSRPAAGVAVAPAVLPRRIAAALRRALAVDPAARFSSMTDLVSALRPRTSRHRTFAAVAGAAAIAGAAVAWFGIARAADDPGAVCASGAANVDRVWNPLRATSIRGAFVATGASFAADTADRVAVLLDGFGARYRRETIDACETTFHRGSASERALEVRSACLDHKLDRVDQLLDVFGHPDRKIVELAINATYDVADLDVCGDVPLLLVRQDEPTDPRVRATIAGLRTTLARGEALDGVGNPKASLPIAQGVAAAADQIAYFPLRAEAAYQVGLVEHELDAHELGDAALRRAIASAESGRDDLLAARAWTHLMSAARLRADFADADRDSEQARAKLERVGNPPGAVGNWLLARARLRHRRGQLAEARADAEQSLALSLAAGVDRPSVVVVSLTLADIYHDLGLRELERQASERAEAVAEKLRGPDHPLTAAALGQLGQTLSWTGALDRATAMYRRALAIDTRVYGEDSVQVSVDLNMLAPNLTEMGDRAGAEAVLRRAYAIRLARLGPDHPSTIVGEINLSVLTMFAHPAEAIEHLQHALAVRQARTPDSAEVALVLHHLGEAQQLAGDREAARASYRRAIAILIATRGPTHSSLAMIWGALGRLDLAIAPAAAIDPLEHAVAIGVRPPNDIATDQFSLAQALWATGRDRARARSLVIAARDALAHIDTAAARRTELDAWLKAHPD